MKFLRNKEIIKSIILQILISAAATVAAFLWENKFGFFTLALCSAFVLVYVLTTLRRYRKIAELSADIEKILHGDDSISFESYTEGELGILQNEISKMTVRLREQSNNLQKDKAYLADSIADISHQIRTPLTSINLLVAMLSEEDITSEKRYRLIHELNDLLSRIDRLITALLKISKLDAGTVVFKKEKVLLSQMIETAVSPLLVPMEINSQVLEVDADGFFFGDLLWTSEAVGNIVKNCTEHTGKEGRIKITARENSLYSEIIIEDDGKGIDREDLPHIFERFYKGKNGSGKSFGIGLALSRMIVTSQNGTIKAENGENKGAVFTIRFYKGTV